ncbi:uncharacterized protein [Rutidosis leptorrhynchoides]|uniref:uncharacterized protein n=1 Tax=Rutidosis leptorrhynchoides TaxID=125765 RepID=UPI003A9956FA
MADEEISIIHPSDNKRKLDDLNNEPLDQSTTDTNANSDFNSPVNAVSPIDPDVKRPRFDNNQNHLELEASKNGQEKLSDKPYDEDIAERSASIETTNNEQGETQTKVDTGLNETREESVTDELNASVVDNAKESDEQEHQDPSPDDTIQQDQTTSAGESISRKMEVPSNKVGVLIGKAGDTVRTLQDNSGARIHITRDAEADPHSTTRSVEIIGSLESVNKAEKLIKDVIAEADAGGSPLLVAKGFSNLQSSAAVEQVQIQVPNDKVRFIIGKGGENIKNLQSRSGARIQCIPQHLPEGDQSTERTVRITGDMRQIEMAKEMIKETMIQPTRSTAPATGYNQQNLRPRGPNSQWGPQSHPSQPTGYDYPQKGPYPSQSSQYSSQGYGNYPPQQPSHRNNHLNWEQRPPPNMQGPPEHTGHDFYARQGAHMHAPSGPGPVMGPPPSQANYNYGPQPTSYPQTASQGYGHGYSDQGPAQHPYGTHGPPPSYNTPQQGPYSQPYGQPRPSQPGDVPYQGPAPPTQSYGANAPPQQPYPYASSGPMQQGYSQYPSAPGPVAYPQQNGQPVSGYTQTGAPQHAPGYAQSAPAASYGQYPATQPGFTAQASTTNPGYGYQGAGDGTYAGSGYGPPSVGLPGAYSQAATVQPGYEQPNPQSGSYGNVPQPQPQPQAGYGQYDNSQMYAGHR